MDAKSPLRTMFKITVAVGLSPIGSGAGSALAAPALDAQDRMDRHQLTQTEPSRPFEPLETWEHAITFSQGSSEISPFEREHLVTLVRGLHTSRGEARNLVLVVAAWADERTPREGDKGLSSEQQELAGARARNIRDALKSMHTFTRTDVYNMARKPGILSTLLQTREATVKAEGTTVGPYKSEEDFLQAIIQNNTREGTALVLIYDARPAEKAALSH